MTPVPKLSDYVRDRLNQFDWSQNKLAKKAKVSRGVMTRVMNDEPLSHSVIERLSVALDVSTETLMRMARRLPAKREGPDPEIDELVTLFDQLDDADKDDILAMARIKAQRKKTEKRGKAKV